MIVNQILLFLFGMVLVFVGAEYSTSSASNLARKVGLPSLIIGLTIFAFGTSAPELFVSVTAALSSSQTVDISLGNILGSNIANIGLALGLPLLLASVQIRRNRDLPETIVMLVATGLFFLLAYTGSPGHELTPVDGIILLFFFVLFLTWLVFRTTSSHPSSNLSEEAQESSSNHWALDLFLILISLTALIWGSDLMVDSSVLIAKKAGVSTAFIGISMVALGTSVPEIAICIVGALRDRTALSLGNIIGSNIFNLLLVGGLASFAAQSPLVMNTTKWIYGGFTFSFSLILLLFVIVGKNLGKKSGLFFLVLYSAFVLYLVSTIA